MNGSGLNSAESIPSKFPLQALFAPFFLSCSYLASIIRGPFAWDLPLMGVLGVLLCWRFRWIGFGLSFVGVTLALFHTLSKGEETNWTLIFALSIISALVLFTLCLTQSVQEEKKAYNSSQGSAEVLYRTEQMLGSCIAIEKTRLESEIEQRKKEIAILQTRLDSVYSDSEQDKLQIDKLNSQILQLHADLNGCTAKMRTILEEQAVLLQSKEQLEEKLLEKDGIIALEISRHQEQHLLVNQLLKENRLIEEKLSLMKEQQLQLEEKEKTKEEKRFEGLYLQLREQFVQKSSILDDTRKQLFLTQEQLEALRKEREENRLEREEELQQEIAALTAFYELELNKQQQENQQLEEIIHSLIVT